MKNSYKKYSLIVAVDEMNGIGLSNCLPWKIPEDMRHFVEKTTGKGNNSVIMGRKTWDSMKKYRPLKNRYNIIISKKHRPENKKNNELENWVGSFESAIDLANNLSANGEIFIIGGSSIYDLAIKENNTMGGIDYLYLTRVHKNFNCDCFFPWNDGFDLVQEPSAHEKPSDREKPNDKTLGDLIYTFEKYTFKK